ncbi:MAG: flavodoxin family protein [Methanosarcinaceae archaeon]|jgi:multimeric flavodoxin WrbA|nr:flavodoxin family protein [Methanosarcinaceae archaeon]NKQ39398.1 flavodoxin family protein [Methanosarcinales archaeon]
MLVVGISGSPRLKGTHYAVNYALEFLKDKGCEIKYLTVARKTIKFCIHCDYCVKKREGKCIHKDDMAEFYEYLSIADGFILGTPVYQGNISAQLKAVMDRCRAIVAKNPKVMAGKVGMGIAIGGDRSGGQETALKTIHDYYMISEIIAVAGGSFGANLGACFWSKDKGKEGIIEDEEGLRSLRKTLKNFYKNINMKNINEDKKNDTI